VCVFKVFDLLLVIEPPDASMRNVVRTLLVRLPFIVASDGSLVLLILDACLAPLIAQKLLVLQSCLLEVLPHFFMLDEFFIIIGSVLPNFVDNLRITHALVWGLLKPCGLWILLRGDDIVLAW
jgi:hypothetical protein